MNLDSNAGVQPVTQPTDYEQYRLQQVQQMEDDMDVLATDELDELKEYQPEGVFVRGH